jgi:hypothetical protein
MINTIISTDNGTEHKLTAEKITEACPTILQNWGKHIAAHLEKARKYDDKAKQHYTAIGEYLARAKQACDDGGFNAFRERFCPDLGRSRTFELLQIAREKKSVDEIRASTRERVAKHRAKKVDESVTVTDSPPEVQEAGTTDDQVEARARPAAKAGESVTVTDSPEAPTVVGELAANARDELLYNFNSAVVEVVRITKNQAGKRFVNTSVPADDLARLGKLLREVATLKRAGTSKPTVTAASCGNDTVSPEESAEEMKARHAAFEEQLDLAA